MVISYRNNPIIKIFENGKLGRIKILENDLEFFQNRSSYIDTLYKTNWNNFKDGKIRVISKEFDNALKNNLKKLQSFNLDNIDDSFNSSGLLIHNKLSTIYYYKINPNDKNNWEYSIFTFHNNILIHINCCWNNYNNNEVDGQQIYRWISKDYINRFDDSYLLTLLIFIKYAPIEIKFVNKQKVLKSNNGKIFNNINTNIEILDSNWFTSIVRNEGFNVSGHFRLQPFGRNKQQRKFIYIKQYKKNGYIRNFKRPLNLEINKELNK